MWLWLWYVGVGVVLVKCLILNRVQISDMNLDINNQKFEEVFFQAIKDRNLQKLKSIFRFILFS